MDSRRTVGASGFPALLPLAYHARPETTRSLDTCNPAPAPASLLDSLDELTMRLRQELSHFDLFVSISGTLSTFSYKESRLR